MEQERGLTHWVLRDRRQGDRPWLYKKYMKWHSSSRRATCTGIHHLAHRSLPEWWGVSGPSTGVEGNATSGSLTLIPWSQGTSSFNATADATFRVPFSSPCLSHTALTFITTQLCSFWVFIWWLFWLASSAPCLQCCCTSWALTFLSLLQSQSSVSVQHLLLCLVTVWMRQQM